jgi:hypothetical protein
MRAREHCLGLLVTTEDSILPFYAPEPHVAQPHPATLDQEPPEGDGYAQAWWRMELAERRMLDALTDLDQATRARLGEQRIAEIEAEFQHEAEVHAHALVLFAG